MNISEITLNNVKQENDYYDRKLGSKSSLNVDFFKRRWTYKNERDQEIIQTKIFDVLPEYGNTFVYKSESVEIGHFRPTDVEMGFSKYVRFQQMKIRQIKHNNFIQNNIIGKFRIIYD